MTVTGIEARNQTEGQMLCVLPSCTHSRGQQSQQSQRVHCLQDNQPHSCNDTSPPSSGRSHRLNVRDPWNNQEIFHTQTFSLYILQRPSKTHGSPPLRQQFQEKVISGCQSQQEGREAHRHTLSNASATYQWLLSPEQLPDKSIQNQPPVNDG